MKTLPQIPHVQMDDNRLSRWMDGVEAAVNPLLRTAQLIPEVFTSTRIPTPDATWFGRTIIVQDVATASTLRVCLRNANGAYSWAVVSISPL
jgi:hypothetical protein